MAKSATERAKKYRQVHRDKVLAKEKEYRNKHRIELNAKAKLYRDAHKDELKAKRMLKKEEKKEYYRQYHIKNKDKQNKYSLEYYWSHEKQEKENHKKYRQKYPEKITAYTKNRIHRKRANGGNISRDEWIDLCNKYDNKCLCCKRSDIKLEIDHIVPIVLGGTHSIDNVQPLCRSCNAHKHAKIIDYRISFYG